MICRAEGDGQCRHTRIRHQGEKSYGAQGIGLCRTERMFTTGAAPDYAAIDSLRRSAEEMGSVCCQAPSSPREDLKEILKIHDGKR